MFVDITKEKEVNMKMEKDKKYNTILGLMILFFLLFVGVCLAWGLGFISVNI